MYIVYTAHPLIKNHTLQLISYLFVATITI